MRVVKLKGVKRINGLHYAPDGRLLAVCGPPGIEAHLRFGWIRSPAKKLAVNLSKPESMPFRRMSRR